jgi:glycosyltransferase involved in cell wall biosynthesis
VPNVLASLDVLVLPSYAHEGIPQIILQSQAMGRPVVATRIGGIPEVVEDNVTGLLVEPRDAAALAAKISALLDDPALGNCLRHAARAQIEAKYSLDAMGEKLLALYDKLLA